MCLGHTDWVGSGTGHSLGTSQGMLTPARGAKCLGEGLRKLLHPQLWFLVGPVVAAGVGGESICHSSNKGNQTKASWGIMGTAVKAPKIKHTFPLIDIGCCLGVVRKVFRLHLSSCTYPEHRHTHRSRAASQTTHISRQSTITDHTCQSNINHTGTHRHLCGGHSYKGQLHGL